VQAKILFVQLFYLSSKLYAKNS